MACKRVVSRTAQKWSVELGMFELVGAAITGLPTLQGIKLLLERGIVLRSRRVPERGAKRRPAQQRWVRTEQEPQRQQQSAQECEAERWRQRRSERVSK